MTTEKEELLQNEIMLNCYCQGRQLHRPALQRFSGEWKLTILKACVESERALRIFQPALQPRHSNTYYMAVPSELVTVLRAKTKLTSVKPTITNFLDIAESMLPFDSANLVTQMQLQQIEE